MRLLRLCQDYFEDITSSDVASTAIKKLRNHLTQRDITIFDQAKYAKTGIEFRTIMFDGVGLDVAYSNNISPESTFLITALLTNKSFSLDLL